MAGFKVTASRELRESVVRLSPPIPFLALLVPLQRVALELNPVVFLLFYGMFLAFLYILARRMIEYLVDLIKESEQERFPSPTFESTDQDSRIIEVTKEFHSGPSLREPITGYESKEILPHVVYSLLSLFWTVVTWAGLILIFGLLISLGLYEPMIAEIRGIDGLQYMFQMIEEVGGVFIILAHELFPDLALEDGFIVFSVMLLTGFLFLTAALNLVAMMEDLNRRGIKWFYDLESPLRSEGVGAIILLLGYLILFQIMINL